MGVYLGGGVYILSFWLGNILLPGGGNYMKQRSSDDVIGLHSQSDPTVEYNTTKEWYLLMTNGGPRGIASFCQWWWQILKNIEYM